MALREMGQDYHYIGFVEQWNRHIEQTITQSRALRGLS